MVTPLVNLPLALPPATSSAVPARGPQDVESSSSASAAASSSRVAPSAAPLSLMGMPTELFLHTISYLAGRRPNPLQDKSIAASNNTIFALICTSKYIHDILQPQLTSLGIVPPLLRPLHDDSSIVENPKHRLILNMRLGDFEKVCAQWNELRKGVTTPGDIAKLVSVEAAPIQLLCAFEGWGCRAGCSGRINDLFRKFHQSWPINYNATSGHDNGLTIAHVAAYLGQDKILNVFLRTYPELIDWRDQMGMTPLFHAARCGQTRTIRALLDCGANLVARDENDGDHMFCSMTPLSYVLHEGKGDEATEALGAMIAYQDERRICIDRASGLPTVLLSIIFGYDMPNFIDEGSDTCHTPLAQAVSRYLISWDEIQYFSNVRAFSFTICSQYKKIIERLLYKKASPNKLFRGLFEKRDAEGRQLSPPGDLEPVSILDAIRYTRIDAAEDPRDPVPPELLSELDGVISLMKKSAACKIR